MPRHPADRRPRTPAAADARLDGAGDAHQDHPQLAVYSKGCSSEVRICKTTLYPVEDLASIEFPNTAITHTQGCPDRRARHGRRCASDVRCRARAGAGSHLAATTSRIAVHTGRSARSRLGIRRARTCRTMAATRHRCGSVSRLWSLASPAPGNGARRRVSHYRLASILPEPDVHR